MARPALGTLLGQQSGFTKFLVFYVNGTVWHGISIGPRDPPLQLYRCCSGNWSSALDLPFVSIDPLCVNRQIGGRGHTLQTWSFLEYKWKVTFSREAFGKISFDIAGQLKHLRGPNMAWGPGFAYRWTRLLINILLISVILLRAYRSVGYWLLRRRRSFSIEATLCWWADPTSASNINIVLKFSMI